jgi:uncharacterized protein YndB with AHSA1/START domain
MEPVTFDVPVEVAFDYLVDPRNRPQWQSSLRRVELVDVGEPREGLRWVDVTRVGVRAQMTLVDVNRPELWSEWGEWRDRVRARLTLAFVPSGVDRCLVVPDLVLGVDGWLGGVAVRVLRLAARPAVRADLRRAARILSERATGH